MNINIDGTNILKKSISKIPDFLKEKIETILKEKDSIILESVGDFKEMIDIIVNEENIKLNVLIRILKMNIKNINIPGIINKNGKLINTSNLDFKVILFLLRKFDFLKNDKNINYINPENNILNKNTLSLGYNDEFENPIELIDESEEDKVFSFKNLGIGIKSESKETHSISYMLIKYLDELKVIPEEEKEHLKSFIDFINLATVNRYEIYSLGNNDSFNFYNYSNKTIFGLSKYISPEKIYKYFKDTSKTGFEILSDEELEKLGLKNLSIKNYKFINSSITEFENRDNKNSLLKDDIEYILDINGNITNCLEVSSSFGKGVIRVHKNGDIVIHSPKSSNIEILKKSDDNYLKDLNFILNEYSGDKAKYSLLKKSGYKGPLYSLIPKEIIEQIIEKEKKEEIKKIKRKARMDSKEYTYEQQKYKKIKINKGVQIYCKLNYLEKGQTQIFPNLLGANEHFFYTTSTALKDKNYFKQNKGKGNNIFLFEIVSISDTTDRGYIKKIKLNQI